jgi:hypothetical protein
MLSERLGMRSLSFQIFPDTFVCLAVVGFELRALHLLCRCFYHLNHAHNPFCFSSFSDRVSYFCQAPAWDCYPPTYACWVARITNVHHHAWLILLRCGLATFFPMLASNHCPPDLGLLSSLDYIHEPPYLVKILSLETESCVTSGSFLGQSEDSVLWQMAF